MITQFKLYEYSDFYSTEEQLCYYAKKGYIKQIKQALINGVNINSISQVELTPLLFACRENEIETVEFLINNGADVNYVTKTGKYNALHISAINLNTIDIFKLLIDAGCDWNQKNKDNQDFIDILIIKNKIEILDKIKKLYPIKYLEYLKKLKARKYNI